MERVAALAASTQTDPASCEQRSAPRVTLLIRPAKLSSAEGEFVCVIRDVSATGVSVRLFHPPPAGKSAQLETETGQHIEMERVRIQGRDVGYSFAEPIDLAALVNEEGRYPKRKLRLAIEMPVRIATLGGDYDAEVQNLSQQGARLECAAKFSIDQIVRLKSHHLPEIRAKVRWRRGTQYGLVFEDTFSLADFAQLAAALQCPSLTGD